MDQLYAQIEKLTFDEFEALLQFIDKTRRKRARQIMSQARRQAARLNLEAGIVPTAKVKNKKAQKPARYADPNNPENTWSGYGRQPEWFKKHLDNGGLKEDLTIA